MQNTVFVFMLLNLVYHSGGQWCCRLHLLFVCLFFVFEWSCWHLWLVRNFLSLVEMNEFLMPGDGTGIDRVSPMTLYGVFLENKVNRTWDAKPQILITCL